MINYFKNFMNDHDNYLIIYTFTIGLKYLYSFIIVNIINNNNVDIGYIFYF